MKESLIVDTVTEYLFDQSFRVVTELPFLQRHIDIVGYHDGIGAVRAIEAKISNWKVAIQQAVTCLLFADEVYIAMPTQYVHRVSTVEIDRFGIGLLAVNGSIEIIHPARFSRYATEYYRNRAIEQFQRLELLRQGGIQYE